MNGRDRDWWYDEGREDRLDDDTQEFEPIKDPIRDEEDGG